MSYKKQIRLYCLWCMNDQLFEVNRCKTHSCILWPYRKGDKDESNGKLKLSRLKSIKERCIDCCNGIKNVKNCKDKKCHLYNYRLGKKIKLHKYTL